MGIDSNLLAEDFTPDPISLLESNRNLGYSIEEAISDLIDNSITAGASVIIYETHWNKGQPYFILKDNGRGMSEANSEFINSFKLGSKSPLEDRDPNDLGRFGFGMKTASLSQSRALTVISKKEGHSILARSLDLNFISEVKQGWRLKHVLGDVIIREVDFLHKNISGTIIKWTDWDRAPKLEEDFTLLISGINAYISVCFHRFIEKGIIIKCHETILKPCSPIPLGEGSSKFSSIKLSNNSQATQTAYILQHPKNWQENYEVMTQFNSFKLFEGFERQQGIYIYRCDRLLTPKGGWLGLLRKGNAAKLARVVIDYPNNADALWSLDITKTNASIPFEFKREIKRLIDAAKDASVTKIVRGNRSLSNNLNIEHSRIWQVSKDNVYNAFKYLVDVDHPVFRHYIKEKKISEKDLVILCGIISENIPISDIIKNNDSDPSRHDRMVNKNVLSAEELQDVKKIFRYQCSEMTKNAAFTWLLSFEPYCYYETQLRKELL
jgi:hypothetical protein